MKDLWKLFTSFFKIGLFTIGGGLAMLPLIQRMVVDDNKWLKENEMIDCIAICQSLPGVIAINAATFVGYRKNKLAGSIAATLGTIMPSLIIIILAAIFLDAAGSNPYVNGAFVSIKAASCGLILFAAVKLGKQVLESKFAWAIAVIAFVMIAVFRVTAVWAIILGAFAGLIPYWTKSKNINSKTIKEDANSILKNSPSDENKEDK
nr:chromate transporter [uncultured Aminipila sp.]